MSRDVPVPGFQNLVLALNEAEYDVANILSFDPDAAVPPGSLAMHRESERPYRLFGHSMSLPAWLILARACFPENSSCDALSCLSAFVAARGEPGESAL